MFQPLSAIGAANMDILANARLRAFSFWLRTGRLPHWASTGTAEFKFNPLHDPDDGRFTFAGTGRYFGRGSPIAPVARMHERVSDRGGARGFNGGGASGCWPASDDEAQRGQNGHRVQSRKGERLPAAALRSRGRAEDPRGLRSIEANGHTWRVDATGSAREVTGTINFHDPPRRSRTVQRQAGGPDRRTTDDGGHYIAPRFGGPAEPFNHFAQDANFNRGGWRALEDEWARNRRAGHLVEYKIVPVFEGSSRRPAKINVWWWVDGMKKSLRFPNERQDNARAKR